MSTPRGGRVRRRKVALEMDEIIRSTPKRPRVDCCSKRIDLLEEPASTPCTTATIEDTYSNTLSGTVASVSRCTHNNLH